jgi:hypothetical protein
MRFFSFRIPDPRTLLVTWARADAHDRTSRRAIHVQLLAGTPTPASTGCTAAADEPIVRHSTAPPGFLEAEAWALGGGAAHRARSRAARGAGGEGASHHVRRMGRELAQHRRRANELISAHVVGCCAREEVPRPGACSSRRR